MESEYNILLVSSHPERMEKEIGYLRESHMAVSLSPPGSEALKALQSTGEKIDAVLLGPAGDDCETYVNSASQLLSATSLPLLFYAEKFDESSIGLFDTVAHRGIIPSIGGPALIRSHLMRTAARRGKAPDEEDPISRLIKNTDTGDGESNKSDYDYIVSGLTDAIIVDRVRTGKQSIANRQACELLGLTREEILEDGIYSGGWEFVHEDLTPYPPEKHPHLIARQTGEPVRNVVMGINRPGRETLWISITSLPVFTRDNRTLEAVITTFFDISELVNIRKNNLRLASIFQNADWGILIEDLRTGNQSFINSTYANMHGYTVEELKGKPIRDLIVPEEREMVEEELKKALSTGFIRFESHHLGKNGKIFPTIADIKVVKDHQGVPLYRTLNVLDFSETKKQEQILMGSIAEKDRLLEALNKEKEYTDTLFNKSPIAIYSLDNESRIVHFNQKAEEITGYGKEELIGERFDIWTHKLEKDNDAGNEYVITTRDGKERIVEKYTSELTDDKGETAGRIESFIDITTWKELQSFRSDMERVIRHDLKTPLNSIIGFPRLMLTDETLSDEYREYLMIILLSGQNMLNLINASLNLYKLEEGTYQFNMEKTDVLAQLQQIRDILRDECLKKGNEITLLLDNQPFPEDRRIRIFTEKSLFTMILINLIKNAVEASPPREAITVSLTEGEDESIEIAIHNKGAIPEQIRERFFDKNVTMGKKHGNGLGTYSARLMASAINAGLSFSTSDSDGTTLFLKL